jgi:exodeoxyribonuclease-5
VTSAFDAMTGDQRHALSTIAAWYRGGGRVPLTLGGLAGTGKTTLVTVMLPQVLPPRTVIRYCAFTGKAVHVLNSKLAEAGTDAEATTCHKLLYRAIILEICKRSGLRCVARDGEVRVCDSCWYPGVAEDCHARSVLAGFTPLENPLKGTDLVVLDEASMMPEKLWRDLTAHGVPVLAVGDHGQLPPVGDQFSLMASPHIRLEQIHRQAEDSPVIRLSMMARQGGYIPPGDYGGGVTRIRHGDLMDGRRFDLDVSNGDMVLCGRNRTRNLLNNMMRAQHGRTGPPVPGDAVICLRNDHEAGIYNGMRGTIIEAEDVSEQHGEWVYRLVASMDGLDAPWEGCALADQFGAPETRNDVTRKVALFDYAYALTVHKAQGSQAPRVMVFEERLPGVDHRRWLYTAVTRTERGLIVVGG